MHSFKFDSIIHSSEHQLTRLDQSGNIICDRFHSRFSIMLWIQAVLADVFKQFQLNIVEIDTIWYAVFLYMQPNIFSSKSPARWRICFCICTDEEDFAKKAPTPKKKKEKEEAKKEANGKHLKAVSADDFFGSAKPKTSETPKQPKKVLSASAARHCS